MLFCTSLVALVGSAENQASNSPRKLQIVNTKVSPDLCEERALALQRKRELN